MASPVISKIQIEGNNVVSFLFGTDYVRSMSQILDQNPTYISYGYDSITISQTGGQAYTFTVYTITDVGGNSFAPITFSSSAKDIQDRTIEIYRLLVTSIFKGCCECGNTVPECSIQYTYGAKDVIGEFAYFSGTPGNIVFNYTTGNNQNFTAFFPLIQDGSWVFIFSKTDPTVYTVLQLSNFYDGGYYCQFDAIELNATGLPFVSGTQFCIDFTSVGGSLVQGWQDTLDINPNLNKDNTIDGGGFDLTFDNNSSFRAVAGFNEIKVTNGYVDIKTPGYALAPTGYALTKTSSGHVEYTAVGSGTVSSVSLAVPTPTNPAFSVSGSPVISSGTLTISANGTTSQYVDGTGALQTFPTIPTAGITTASEGLKLNPSNSQDVQLGSSTNDLSASFSGLRYIWAGSSGGLRIDGTLNDPFGKGILHVDNSSGSTGLGQQAAISGWSNGTGLYGYSSGSDVFSAGVKAAAQNGYGVYAQSVNGIGIRTYSDNNTPLHAQRASSLALAGTPVEMAYYYRQATGGTVSPGGGMKFTYDIGAGTGAVNAHEIRHIWTNTTAGSQLSQYEIWGNNLGTLQQHLTLKGTGQLQLNNYTNATSFQSGSGSPVGILNVDNSGNIFVGTGGTTSPLTTKGDLYVYSTANTRLPVGSNGQILYADSTTATGLKWDAAPTGGGGGGKSYYLNGGTTQLTTGGVTYYQMSPSAVVGTNVDFNISADGYIASFITNAGDPNQTVIPAGNWNFELWFSASSSGGTPSFYVALYKYDGTTFTWIADNSLNPEGITNGTATDLYFTALAIPQTTLTSSDRLAVRVWVNHSGRTITLHTQDNHLCQIITTFPSGIVSLNGLTGSSQSFVNDTNVTITSSGTDHTLGWTGQLSVSRGGTGVSSLGSVTAASNKITLGGTPAASVVNAFSIDVNEANLTLDNIGGTLGTSKGGTGLTSIGSALQYLRVNSAGTALEYVTLSGGGITSLNGLTASTQTFATPGTTGTAPSWTSATSTHTLNIPLASAAGVTAGLISKTEYDTFNNKVSSTRSVLTSSPLSGGGDLSADRTLSITDAVADGVTKGAAAFAAADFNSTSGVISLDYTNGQKASDSQPGFLAASDFTRLKQDTFTFRCALGPVSPADGAIYYVATTTPSLSLSATTYRNTAPYACKLVGAEIQATNTVTNASNEASTLNFRLNNTTDVLLSNAVILGGTVNISNTYTVTGLNQSIAAGDTFNVKWTTPTWATNPTSVVIAVTLFFERT